MRVGRCPRRGDPIASRSSRDLPNHLVSLLRRVHRELEQPPVQEEEAADPDDAEPEHLGDEHGCGTDELSLIAHCVLDKKVNSVASDTPSITATQNTNIWLRWFSRDVRRQTKYLLAKKLGSVLTAAASSDATV